MFSHVGKIPNNCLKIIYIVLRTATWHNILSPHGVLVAVLLFSRPLHVPCHWHWGANPIHWVCQAMHKLNIFKPSCGVYLCSGSCRRQPLKQFKLHWAAWSDMNILGASPSAAAIPQDDSGVVGNSSSLPSLSAILPAEMVSLKCSLHARVAHRRHRVLPVPVGLSRTPFTLWKKQADVHWFHLWSEILPNSVMFSCLLSDVNSQQGIRCFINYFLIWHLSMAW